MLNSISGQLRGEVATEIDAEASVHVVGGQVEVAHDLRDHLEWSQNAKIWHSICQ